MCYEHDEDGRPLSGSLDELIAAVRNGLTIKVGVHALSSLVAKSTTVAARSGDDTISFLPGLQPLVKHAHVAMNCDAALIGPPHSDAHTYAKAMELAFLKPSTSGEVEVYTAKPGATAETTYQTGFTRYVQRAAMRWLVADYA